MQLLMYERADAILYWTALLGFSGRICGHPILCEVKPFTLFTLVEVGAPCRNEDVSSIITTVGVAQPYAKFVRQPCVYIL